MQSNRVNGQPDIADITIVTDERQIIVPQLITNVVEVNTPGPAGPAGTNGTNGTSVDTGSLVTTSSFNAFTSSINAFTASYNTGSFSGSFTGNLTGTASWAEYVVNGGNVNTSGFATTGSNTFVGNQIISGNIIPAGPYVNNTSSYNLGSPTAAWKDLYVSNGSVTFINGAASASIKLSGSNIIFDGASVTLPTSSTVTAAATASYVNPLNQNLIVSGNFIIRNSTTGLDSINSDSYYLFDSNGNRSVMWDQRVLRDSNGAGAIDWESRAAADGNLLTSIDWQNRELFADDGVGGAIQQMNWSNPDYIQLFNLRTGSASNILIADDSGRLFKTASNSLNVATAQTASYLNNLNQNLTLNGSLTVLNNLTVFGTQSIVYITSSQLDISTNIITVNTSTPAIRFGGIAVRDSGSLATGLTGSLLWDSQNDVWIYSNPSGAAYDGGMLLTGPRNTSGLGNEIGINSGYAAVGNGSHHMTSSAIYSSGSLIRLENNTQVTGSLNVSAGITGSLFGTASWAVNFVSASNYVLNSATSSFIQNSQTSSFVTNSQTSSMSVATASYVQTVALASNADNVFVSENLPNNYPWSIPVIEGSGGGYSLLHATGPTKDSSAANWFFPGGVEATGFFPNAGSTVTPPLKLTAGTNLTSPQAGAIEYDGTTLYRTNDTTSGRGYEPSTQIFRLTASLAAIGSTIANFFGSNSAIQLAGGGIYEIEAYCYFTKTTTATATVTISSSLAPVNLNGIIQYGASAGNGAANQIALFGSTATAAAFAASATLNNGVNHAFTIRLLVESNASNSNLRFLFTESAGTVTPLRSSYYKVTRLPSSNSGNFVA